jgi:hypothetical protein
MRVQHPQRREAEQRHKHARPQHYAWSGARPPVPGLVQRIPKPRTDRDARRDADQRGEHETARAIA